MTPQKIAQVATYYSTLLREQGVVSCRIDPDSSFATQDKTAVLAHVLYLCERIPTYACTEEKNGKAHRHLAAAQMCLSFVGWFTLNELRVHNAP
jgi:hypothetical protein